MRQKLFVSILLATIFFLNASAQQKTITGMVKAKDGTPLFGASVTAIGENKSVITNSDGTFSIVVSPATTALQISYVGSASQTLSLPASGYLDVTMEASATDLQDVVVVGYSSQKKTTITGAIAAVNMQDLEQRRVADVAQALQGQVAGVQVTQSTGAPGDQINIRIRGEGTIGNNSPLFIVDGIPTILGG